MRWQEGNILQGNTIIDYIQIKTMSPLVWIEYLLSLKYDLLQLLSEPNIQFILLPVSYILTLLFKGIVKRRRHHAIMFFLFLSICWYFFQRNVFCSEYNK